jgi:RNA polymerase sigma factor (sigma-70 family)
VRPYAELDLVPLVTGARRGDERAWAELVRRYDGALRAVAKGYRLGQSDVDEVVQTTWFRAVCRVSQLQHAYAIRSWLITTTRREAMRHLQRGVNEVPIDDPSVYERPDASVADALAEREQHAAVREAVRRLSGRQRRLLAIMLDRPGVTYDEVSATLGMPIGSIGPTRERAIDKLRKDPGLARAVSGDVRC